MTIILHGMCYSGKSTLGKLLAEKIEYPFSRFKGFIFQRARNK